MMRMATFRAMLPAVLLTVCSAPASAAGYTGWAVPSELEYVNGGILVRGAFGDPNGCGTLDYIFVPNDAADSKDFQPVMSMILTALTTKRQMRFFSNSCAEVPFHWNGPVISQTRPGQAVYIR